MAGITKMNAVVMRPSRLTVCTEGREKSGKSKFALSAPGPILYIESDSSYIGPLSDTVETGKKVEHLHFEYDAGDKAGSSAIWDELHDEVLSTIGKDPISGKWQKNHTPAFRTIVFDTATELYNLSRARRGVAQGGMPQAYGAVYADMNVITRALSDPRNDKVNAIFIHRVKREFKMGVAQEKSSWFGNYERSGYRDLPSEVQVNLKHMYRPGAMGDSGEFITTVLSSGVNHKTYEMEFEGMMSNFLSLVMATYPKANLKEWGF